MSLSPSWYRPLEFALLVLVIVVLGVFRFSRVTPELRRELELEAGLEQLHLLEQAHFEVHGRYFDPSDPSAGLKWAWMAKYEWEVRIQADGFWIAARADLDGDGEKGVWLIDHQEPVVHRPVED